MFQADGLIQPEENTGSDHLQQEEKC